MRPLNSLIMMKLSHSKDEEVSPGEVKKMRKEMDRLIDELDKMTAQCEACEEALDFADDLAAIAKLATWGTENAMDKARKLVEKHNDAEGIWDNWDIARKELKSGAAMRRKLGLKK